MLFYKVQKKEEIEKIDNQISIPVYCGTTDMKLWNGFINNEEFRKELWERGMNIVKEFKNNLNNSINELS